MNFHETVNQSRRIRLHEDAYNIKSRYRDLSYYKSNAMDTRPVQDRIPDIPEEDLHVIKKIYHKMYSDCGRKRGALMRYIKHFRETQEPENFSKRFFSHLRKLQRRALK